MERTPAGADSRGTHRRRSASPLLAVEAAGLAKQFGTTRALAGVDLAIRSGTVYGLLGPNGAGKTTTVRILATLLAPDSGQARALGHHPATAADAATRRLTT